MKLTQKQIETIKVLAEFLGDNFALSIINSFEKLPNNALSQKDCTSYLTDLNKLAEIFSKLEPRIYNLKKQRSIMDRTVGYWVNCLSGDKMDCEIFAHQLAQIITELKLNDKEKQ